MLRFAAAICLVVMLPSGLAGQAPQQEEPPKLRQTPDTGPPEVLVMLQAGTPRKLTVGPRGVGLCPGMRGCDDQMTFVWIGTKNDGEEIVVEFDDPLVAEACLGASTVTLVGIGRPYAQSLTATESCTGKRALFYTVSCRGGENGDCGGVAPVDPGMIIDGGGG